MKLRSFLVILMMAIGLLTSVDVKAAEIEEKSEIEPEDDLGEQTYSLDFFMASIDTNNPIGYLCRKSSGSITVDGARLCGYREYLSVSNCYVYYIYTYNSTTCFPGITLSTTTGTGITGCYLYLSESWYMEESKNDSFNYKEYDYLLSPYLMRIYPDCDWQYISTSIPIFEGKEQMLAFMNGEITEKAAINYEDTRNFEYDSAEVPIPKKMKVQQEGDKYYISWEQSSDDLEHITSAVFNKEITGGQYEVDEDRVYPGFPTWKFEELSPALIQKIDITDILLSIKQYCKENDIEDYKIGVDLSVRNKWEKNSTDTLYSTYVHAILTISYSYSGGLEVSVSYEETDKNGDFIEDSDYNDIFDSSGIIKDDFTSAGSSSFIYNLFTGFGMLGDNGLLSFMKGVFSCFPSFIWELLGTGLSAMIIVALFKTLFS